MGSEMCIRDRSDTAIQSIWEKSDIQKLTEYTITDFADFYEMITQIRKTGYAIDNEENELGVRCIAVSLKGFQGKPTYAISVSAPKDRMPDERIDACRKLILETKNHIQQEMGF